MRRTLDRVRQQRPTVERISIRPIRRNLLIAMAAAASLAGVALWVTSDWRSEGAAEVGESPPFGRSTEAPPELAGESNPMPTMWAYLEVLREDPESLDDLLEAHASRLGNADPESLRMGMSLNNRVPTTEA